MTHEKIILKIAAPALFVVCGIIMIPAFVFRGVFLASQALHRSVHCVAIRYPIKFFNHEKDNNFCSNLDYIFAMKFYVMKKWQVILSFIFLFLIASATVLHAQCSICTKAASQLGEKPAEGMNSGIIYLMFAPFAIAAFIGIRWWKQEKASMKEEEE